ncbi:MAG: hypothetical protein SF339_27825 [Blastocatellia bacterium]|nr:hypothetical protein [Blastocatellia bacterium]
MANVRWSLALLFLLLLAVSGFAQAADEAVPEDRITIRELKRKMEAGEKMVILDARKGSAWIGSFVKIKGAVHCTNDDLEAKMPDLPKEQEIIVYCA